MKRISVLLLAAVLLATLTLSAAARPIDAAPELAPDSPSATLFNYQGQLEDASGKLITNAAQPMTFKLFTQETGGTACWTEARTGSNAVDVKDGLFNVLLGKSTTIPASCLTGDAYLEIMVGTETLSPRERMTSVMHAVEATTLPPGASTRGNLTVQGNLSSTGNASFGSSSAGDRARLAVVGGALSVSKTSAPADASLHITGAQGLGDRLFQMSPVGNSQPAVALIGSTDASGNGQWWEWGVTPSNTFRIVPGFSLDGYPGLTVYSDGSVRAGGLLAVGVPGLGEGGELNLAAGDSGNAWTLDNERGKFRLHHDGTVYTTVAADGSLWTQGDVSAGHFLHVQGTDFIFDEFGGRGGGRAMVNDNGDILTINYGSDFSGGVRIQGAVSCGALVESNLQTTKEQASGGTDRFSEGDVLCWGIDQLELCKGANDRLVQAVADKAGKPIVIGAEAVKVLGPVHRGDPLVASDVAGHAMANENPRAGSVIAQALEDFSGKQGTIKAMIRKW